MSGREADDPKMYTKPWVANRLRLPLQSPSFDIRDMECTPIETEGLIRILNEGNWRDLVRHHIPVPQKLYTWWSYRAKDWDAADKGRRLDHIWSSADLGPKLTNARVLREARGWERPSDHVPVMVTLDI